MSRNKWAWLGFFCLLAAWASAQSGKSAASPAQTFRMSGIAVDALSGQPLAGVEVSTGPAAEAPPGQSVTTEEDGRFEFTGLKPGKYWLMAQGRGYARQAFNGHAEFSTAIAVGPNLESANLEFRLRPAASISGSITDEAGDAVRHAQVMLFQDVSNGANHLTGQRTQVNSDDQGHFSFGHLPPGRFFVAAFTRPWYAEQVAQSRNVVRASAENSQAGSPGQQPRSPLDVAYPVTFYAGVTDENAATPLELKAGDHISADITLTAVPAMHMVVSAPSNNDGVGAILTQRIFGGTEIPIGTETSVVGHNVEVSGVSEGPVELKLESFGQKRGAWSRTVNLTDGGQIAAEQFSSPSELSGVLTLDGAVPPTRMFVRLCDRDSGRTAGGMIDEKGEFHINGGEVRPGNYEVDVFNLPGATVRTVTAEGAKAGGRNIRITGEGPVKLKVEATRNLSDIVGVALRNGKPMAGVMVVLVPHDIADVSLYRRDQSDSDGTFTLHGALPGNYSVVALSDWDTEWLNPAVMKAHLKATQPIEVTAGKVKHVEVKVQ